MSAEMATKVQAKSYFPSSMMDLNNGLYNAMWDPYHDDRNHGYNSFLMSQVMDGYPGYPKEQMRQTILKQESIFRHQLQELHRLYKRQRYLMNELTMKDHYCSTIPAEAPSSSHLLSQVCSQISKETCTQRRVIDLELPADVEDDNEGNQPVKNIHNLSTKKTYNLADLNEPIQMEEASLINKNSDYGVTDNIQKQDISTNSKFWYLHAVPKKAHQQLSSKKTIFGVELCESSHKPPFDSSLSSSWDQNTSSLNHNHWIEPREKHEVFYGKKNLENQLPHWLMKTKAKETIVYQMNLNSLQQHSQQFFKKAEKLETDNIHGITKILGVPIVNIQDSATHTHDTNDENYKSSPVLESRHDIDLNLSFDEEEDLSSTPNVTETVVSIASMGIDLEAPAAIEAETDDVFMDADVQELVKSAAEAIMSISSSDPPPADTLLRWFAEVIASGEDDGKDSVNVNKDEDCIPEGMDYFEYMTLKLQETEVDDCCFKAVIVVEKEEDGGLLRKQVARKGQGKRGRQRKDFQRDVLPGIVSLSRREVTEDLQTFEEAFNDIGVSWQSKRKAGRGRRRSVVLSPQTLPPPPPPPPEVAVEQSVCREVALEEKSLSGWGKRTRRLPRQRCQNGGNHQSLALKC
ncbi:hypothetical protein L1987_24602 [Smallanthus sonchifolius]|uniref:Uncharacterized protein n=1 Tax=Smallanthus sonchifolius TaxID=185202 RepID=A0ACB9IMC8_9ASTR|nr:hypothetical protein L1987_24602 [Smallanthus sonchifolius]